MSSRCPGALSWQAWQEPPQRDAPIEAWQEPPQLDGRSPQAPRLLGSLAPRLPNSEAPRLSDVPDQGSPTLVGKQSDFSRTVSEESLSEESISTSLSPRSIFPGLGKTVSEESPSTCGSPANLQAREHESRSWTGVSGDVLQGIYFVCFCIAGGIVIFLNMLGYMLPAFSGLQVACQSVSFLLGCIGISCASLACFAASGEEIIAWQAHNFVYIIFAAIAVPAVARNVVYEEDWESMKHGKVEERAFIKLLFYSFATDWIAAAAPLTFRSTSFRTTYPALWQRMCLSVIVGGALWFLARIVGYCVLFFGKVDVTCPILFGLGVLLIHHRTSPTWLFQLFACYFLYVSISSVGPIVTKVISSVSGVLQMVITICIGVCGDLVIEILSIIAERGSGGRHAGLIVIPAQLLKEWIMGISFITVDTFSTEFFMITAGVWAQDVIRDFNLFGITKNLVSARLAKHPVPARSSSVSSHRMSTLIRSSVELARESYFLTTELNFASTSDDLQRIYKNIRFRTQKCDQIMAVNLFVYVMIVFMLIEHEAICVYGGQERVIAGDFLMNMAGWLLFVGLEIVNVVVARKVNMCRLRIASRKISLASAEAHLEVPSQPYSFLSFLSDAPLIFYMVVVNSFLDCGMFFAGPFCIWNCT